MIPIDFSGKVALVTGVGDNESFAWFISKALQAAGAKIVLACHPRMVGIVQGFRTRRLLPFYKGVPLVMSGDPVVGRSVMTTNPSIPARESPLPKRISFEAISMGAIGQFLFVSMAFFAIGPPTAGP
jgi:hypothetical protein